MGISHALLTELFFKIFIYIEVKIATMDTTAKILYEYLKQLGFGDAKPNLLALYKKRTQRFVPVAVLP